MAERKLEAVEIRKYRNHKNRLRNPKMSSYRGLYNRNKNAAKKRGLYWDIDFDYFQEVISRPCVWCGIEPSTKYNSCISINGYTQRKYLSNQVEDGWILYNGLDRINNKDGYRNGNICPCCKTCNFARNSLTVEEFLVWIERLTKYANSSDKRHPFQT